jgi:hypothetical protein
MSDERLWRAQRLTGLQEMLGRLIDDERAARAVDTEKAAHLADAVLDLRTIIGRLEAEERRSPTSDGASFDRSSGPAARKGDPPPADPPVKRHTASYGMGMRA